MNLVDIYNIIEAFRENGLHVLDHDSDIHESKLEAVLSSIFYALNKRIPSTTDIDVERCIALVKHWLLYAYDRCVIKLYVDLHICDVGVGMGDDVVAVMMLIDTCRA